MNIVRYAFDHNGKSDIQTSKWTHRMFTSFIILIILVRKGILKRTKYVVS